MDENKPRKLTDEEIETILEYVIPVGEKAYNEEDKSLYSYPIPSATYQTSMSIRESIFRRLRKQLKNAPPLTPMAIDDLIREMIKQYISSRANPATTVGISAAEALGGTLTQTALNSFHKSGSASDVVSSIDALRELLHVTEKKLNQECTVHFKDKTLTFYNVFNKRPDLVERTLDSLVHDYETIVRKNTELEWWHKAYMNLNNVFLMDGKYILRITLRTELLYNYRITIEDIARKIREENGTDKIIVIPSPLGLGLIDIFPIDDNINESVHGEDNGVNMDNKSSLFINTLIYTFPEIHLKGIPKVENLRPVSILLKEVVTEQELVEYRADLKKIKWNVTLSKLRMKTSGIELENFKHLFKHVPGMFHKKTVFYDRIIVLTIMIDLSQFPDIDLSSQQKLKENLKNTKPFTIIDKLHDQERKRIIDSELAANKRQEIKIEEGSVFYNACSYVYAKVQTNSKGSSGSVTPFINLMKRDDIDQMHTICNNPRDVNRYLGIEAARQHHIMAFGEILADGKHDFKIDLRHVILLVDFMTNMGEILPITFTGLQRQRMGPLDKATHEKSMDSFRDGAGMGVREEIKSISSEIAVGKRIGSGTGHMGIKIDEEMIAKYRHLYENKTHQIERVHLPDEAARANVLIDTFLSDGIDTSNLFVPSDVPLPQFDGEDYSFDVASNGVSINTSTVSPLLTKSASTIKTPVVERSNPKILTLPASNNVVTVSKRSMMKRSATPHVIRTTLNVPSMVSNLFTTPSTTVYTQDDDNVALPSLTKIEPPSEDSRGTYDIKDFMKNIQNYLI